MRDHPDYSFSPLRDSDLTLQRGSGSGMAPVLLLTAENTSLACLKRLEHEYALRAELDGAWAAHPIELSRHRNRLALLLEDPGGVVLDQLLGRPLEIAEFLPIAISLAGALRQVHARGLIHKDIKPANVLVDVATGGVWLTGFGIAWRLPREHQNPGPTDRCESSSCDSFAPNDCGGGDDGSYSNAEEHAVNDLGSKHHGEAPGVDSEQVDQRHQRWAEDKGGSEPDQQIASSPCARQESQERVLGPIPRRHLDLSAPHVFSNNGGHDNRHEPGGEESGCPDVAHEAHFTPQRFAFGMNQQPGEQCGRQSVHDYRADGLDADEALLFGCECLHMRHCCAASRAVGYFFGNNKLTCKRSVQLPAS